MKFLRLLLVPFAALVVIAARLGLPIRFGRIWSDRMGHMAGNMECYLCERAAGLSQGWDVWFHGAEPCSAQLAKMLARVVRIDPTPFTRICALVNRLFAGWQKYEIDPVNVDLDIYNLMEKQPPHLSFTPEEEARGQHGLIKLGIPRGAKWIYLIVRDAAKHPHLPYHSYRNPDIKDHAPAAKWLVDRGYYVVRMGKGVLHPMPIKHPRIIDFAMQKPHDDFMAVYLGAHCAFCLSTGTGPDAIPVIFRRPICYVNYVPVEYLQTYNAGSLAIWKHHEKDGKRMTLAEIYASGSGHFMRAEQFEEAGIKLVDNTPQEIMDATVEMTYRIEGKPGCWPACEARHRPGYEVLHAEDTQARFWDHFPRTNSTYTGKPLHGAIRMRIGTEFLNQYAPLSHPPVVLHSITEARHANQR